MLLNEFSTLTPDQKSAAELSPLKVLRETGQQLDWPLGELLSFTKRPHAPIQVLLVIHYDTVYDLWRTVKRTKKLLGITFQSPYTPEFGYFADKPIRSILRQSLFSRRHWQFRQSAGLSLLPGPGLGGHRELPRRPGAR